MPAIQSPQQPRFFIADDPLPLNRKKTPAERQQRKKERNEYRDTPRFKYLGEKSHIYPLAQLLNSVVLSEGNLKGMVRILKKTGANELVIDEMTRLQRRFALMQVELYAQLTEMLGTYLNIEPPSIHDQSLAYKVKLELDRLGIVGETE